MPTISFHKTRPPIALLTDFGTRDNYVGVMKGVIYRICPEARIVDLSHSVGRQDVTEASFLLSSSYEYFPKGTIFVCVVDPGVGTGRAIVCMEANNQFFLAPDNGLLSVVAAECSSEQLMRVTNTRYFLDEISATFHGRDIFAPVAAHLCEGLDPGKLGRPMQEMRGLDLPNPVRTTGGNLKGQFVYVDQFGNLVSNISLATLERILQWSVSDLEIRAGDENIGPIRGSYGEVPEGHLLALIGSSGYLEVAINKGSAAEKIGCSREDQVLAKPRKKNR